MPIVPIIYPSTWGAESAKINSNFEFLNAALYTETLFVSKNGDGTDGSTLEKAYTTLQDALDAASVDPDDLTLILLAPCEGGVVGTPGVVNTKVYDINTTGTPTWTGNYEIKGTHRIWALIENNHASAAAIMKFTGKVSISDVGIRTTAAINGVIITGSHYRIRRCGFNSQFTTGSANNLIHIDGTGGEVVEGIIDDVEILGNIALTSGIVMTKASICNYINVHFHFCLEAIHIDDALSINNYFDDLDIGGCATGIHIVAGVSQHFNKINFHENTLNVNDEAGEHHWNGITGEFSICVEPQSITGLRITGGSPGYGLDTELIAAGAISNPFKIIAYQVSPEADENTLLRLSADSGLTYFTESIFATKKGKAAGGGDATDFIFNKGARISGSVLPKTNGKYIDVWLEVQEI